MPNDDPLPLPSAASHSLTESAPLVMSPQLRSWLKRAVESGASDLHLIAGHPPVLRLNGELTELPEPPLTGDEAREHLRSLCRPEVFARIEAQKNIDFSIEVDLDGRHSRF